MALSIEDTQQKAYCIDKLTPELFLLHTCSATEWRTKKKWPLMMKQLISYSLPGKVSKLGNRTKLQTKQF